MVSLPVRGLSKVGIVKDSEPWDVPWEAWSAGSNVRFQDGKALRGPVMRRVVDTAGSVLVDLATVVSVRPSTGYDAIFAVDSAGRVGRFVAGSALSDVSGAGFAPASSTTQFTSAYLGDCLFLNRETHPPRYWGPASSAWATVPNWDSTWRCNVLRAHRDFLFGYNVTKAGTNTGTMVKWSDATLAGAPPGSWDTTVSTNLAGENVLAGMDGPIVEAANLRNEVVIYGGRQVWLQEYTGDKTFPFTFRKLWDDPSWGALGRNCAVEVDGQHYVFGSNDLYVHDGVSKPQSIADGKVRRHVFATMNRKQAGSFFVAHNAHLSEVLFCYVAGGDVAFPGTARPNRAAVFNTRGGTWSFYDLPAVGGWCSANASTALTWGQDTHTWAVTGGSWLDQADGYKPTLLLAGNTLAGRLTAPRIYALDPAMTDSRVNLPMDTEANAPAYLEHGGISLDAAQLPLQNFKWVRGLYPAARCMGGSVIKVSVGAAETTDALPAYQSAVTFDPRTDYFVPARVSGRYVAVRFDIPALMDADVTGFDLDVVGGGKR